MSFEYGTFRFVTKEIENAEDVAYVQRKLFQALKIPPSYLGFNDD